MTITKTITAALLALGLLGFGCDIEETQEGRAPEVDVDPGEVPEYDVDGPEVRVGSHEERVRVPDVDVTTPDDDEIIDDEAKE